MIFTPADLQNTYIDINVDKRILTSTMIFVEDIYVKPVMPAEMFDPLSGEELTPEAAAMKKDLLPAYGWFVNAEIIFPLSQKTKNAGLLSNSGDGYSGVNISDQAKLRDYYLHRAEAYMLDFKKKYFTPKEGEYDNNNFCLNL